MKKKSLITMFILSALMVTSVTTLMGQQIGATDEFTYGIGADALDSGILQTYYYTFINPTAGATVSGTVAIKIQATYNSLTLYRVRIAVYRNSRAITSFYDMTHSGSNIWTINWNTANYADGSGYSLRFVLYRTSTSYTSVYCNNLVINNGGGGTPPPSGTVKIGVFFWATDAGTSAVISKYIGYLQTEGYTKFYNFRDSTNVQADCSSVDNGEDSDDIIFLYIIAHGNNNGAHSYSTFRPGGSVVYSNTFRTYMNAWEATRKGLLVESCHSGDWADDFAASPYIAMSTSDETHLSYALSTLPGEGKFSYYFFQRVRAGYTAVDAYNYARSYCTNQYPKIRNYSSYAFFS